MNQSKVNEAIGMAKKYGVIQNGELTGTADIAKKIINENGGTGTFGKAINYANNPLVKMGLKKLGIDDDTLKGAISELNGSSGSIPHSNAQNGSVVSNSSLSDRLNRLK
ncbi:MAG: hypothetical protein R3Y09_06600 [Clostridia bacterium]